MPPVFSSYMLQHGLLADLSADPFASTLCAWTNAPLELDGDATHFGFVIGGTCTLRVEAGAFKLVLRHS